MEWTKTYPKKKGFYWYASLTDLVSIAKRSGKTGIWLYGGDSADAKDVAHWGAKIEMPSDIDDWSKAEPKEEGWYAVCYDDKTKGIVRLAVGDKLHCYDFEIPGEINLRKVVSWNGPLQVPPQPKTPPPAKK